MVRETVLPDGTPWMTASAGDTRMLHREIFVDTVYQDLAIAARASGHLIVDVGANSGLSALYLARHAPEVPILALEPAPVTYACLAMNTARHIPTAIPVQIAVGESNGVASLSYYPRTPSQSGLHAERSRDDALTTTYLRNIGFDEAAIDHSLRGLHVDATTCSVPCARLDILINAFYPHLEKGIFVKIDVERSELDVLAGLEHCWSAVDGVVCEIEERDGELDEAVRLLQLRGFATRTSQQATLEGSPLWVISAYRRASSTSADNH